MVPTTPDRIADTQEKAEARYTSRRREREAAIGRERDRKGRNTGETQQEKTQAKGRDNRPADSDPWLFGLLLVLARAFVR